MCAAVPRSLAFFLAEYNTPSEPFYPQVSLTAGSEPYLWEGWYLGHIRHDRR